MKRKAYQVALLATVVMVMVAFLSTIFFASANLSLYNITDYFLLAFDFPYLPVWNIVSVVFFCSSDKLS